MLRCCEIPWETVWGSKRLVESELAKTLLKCSRPAQPGWVRAQLTLFLVNNTSSHRRPGYAGDSKLLKERGVPLIRDGKPANFSGEGKDRKSTRLNSSH